MARNIYARHKQSLCRQMGGCFCESAATQIELGRQHCADPAHISYPLGINLAFLASYSPTIKKAVAENCTAL